MKKILVTSSAGILFLFCDFNEVLAQWGGSGGRHMGPGMMGEWGMGWFGGLFALIF